MQRYFFQQKIKYLKNIYSMNNFLRVFAISEPRITMRADYRAGGRNKSQCKRIEQS